MELFKDEKIKKLIKVIQESIKLSYFDKHIYIVGGAVRNALLGLPIKDIDIVVDIQNGGILFANYMAARHRCFKLNSNPVIFEAYGTAKFQLYNDEDLKGIEIECVQTRKEQYRQDSRNPTTSFGTIQEDCKRRDLTINALYYNVSTGQLSDFTNMGLNDLDDQIIRTTNDPNIIFNDDPLRMLRCIRFSAQLGWGIERDTWLGIINNVNRLSVVSKERIADEITKILLCKKPSIGVRKLFYSGLLDKIMPDIYDLNLAYESRTKAITTFEHTMDVLDETQPYIENRLAALFHDVGKVVTDKDRSISQDQFSSEVTEYDLKLMKFPNYIVKSVTTAIKYHRWFKIYPDGVTPPDKKIRKFINLCGDEIGTVVDLMNANNQNMAFDKKKRQVLDILNRIEELEELDKIANVKLPISGNDLIKEFNLKSGPTVGILMDAIKDAYFEDPNITKDGCFKVAEDKLKILAI